ncbi:MAG: PIG-L family deacetylase [Bacteroidetes bacterium]|nr:PIG-L family deacetylase [Bacteroidota bacterium]
MNKLICTTIFVVLGLFSFSQKPLQGKTILAIFAHPDDESTIGPVLAKYATLGADVYLAVATDGRYGTNSHSNIPAGDTLAAVRNKEMHCAAEKLGIHPPIMIGMHDQLNMKEGKTGETLRRIRDTVIYLFKTINPDVVLTWGASGWTLHPDHQLIGDVVTDIFSSRIWPKHPKLYYGEIPTGSIPADAPQFATVDQSYLTVAIDIAQADLDKAHDAWSCHKSQYIPSDIEYMRKAVWHGDKLISYFRPFVSTGKMQNTLFPDMEGRK